MDWSLLKARGSNPPSPCPAQDGQSQPELPLLPSAPSHHADSIGCRDRLHQPSPNQTEVNVGALLQTAFLHVMRVNLSCDWALLKHSEAHALLSEHSYRALSRG